MNLVYFLLSPLRCTARRPARNASTATECDILRLLRHKSGAPHTALRSVTLQHGSGNNAGAPAAH